MAQGDGCGKDLLAVQAKETAENSYTKVQKAYGLKYLSCLTPLLLVERGDQKVLFLFLT